MLNLEYVKIKRAHWVSKKVSGKSRTIVVTKVSSTKKQKILNKLKDFKGTGVFVNGYHLKETMVIRKYLWRQVKEWRKQNDFAILFNFIR